MTVGRFGSLLLGLYDAEGRLDHVGFTSAFKAGEKADLLDRLAPLEESLPYESDDASLTFSIALPLPTEPSSEIVTAPPARSSGWKELRSALMRASNLGTTCCGSA